MATSIWQPGENFIRNGVRENYTTAVKVSTFHFNALTTQSSNAAIAALLTIFTPKHNALINASSTKESDLGDRIGDTKTKDDLLLDLTQNQLPEWQRLIGNVYRKKSAAFKTLFPYGLKPFNSGTIDNRILAVKTLRDKCVADASLSVVAALIVTFYTTISTARTAQEGEKTDVTFDIGNQLDAIEQMCITQFADYGAIVNLFPNNSNKIKSFFDVVNLQKHMHSNLYEGVVNKNKIRNVATKTVKARSTIRVTCDVDLQVWVIDSSKNKAHPHGSFVPAGVPTIIGFPDLGDFNNRVFQIQNLSLTTQGHYSIEFL